MTEETFDPIAFAKVEFGGEWDKSDDGAAVYCFMPAAKAKAISTIFASQGNFTAISVEEGLLPSRSCVALHVNTLKNDTLLQAARGEYTTIGERAAAEVNSIILQAPTIEHEGRLTDTQRAQAWLLRLTGISWEINTSSDGPVLVGTLPNHPDPAVRILKEQQLLEGLESIGLGDTDDTLSETPDGETSSYEVSLEEILEIMEQYPDKGNQIA